MRHAVWHASILLSIISDVSVGERVRAPKISKPTLRECIAIRIAPHSLPPPLPPTTPFSTHPPPPPPPPPPYSVSQEPLVQRKEAGQTENITFIRYVLMLPIICTVPSSASTRKPSTNISQSERHGSGNTQMPDWAWENDLGFHCAAMVPLHLVLGKRPCPENKKWGGGYCEGIGFTYRQGNTGASSVDLTNYGRRRPPMGPRQEILGRRQAGNLERYTARLVARGSS